MVKLKEICDVDWGDTSLTKTSYTTDGKYLGVSAAGCDGRMDYYDFEAFTPVMSAIGANCGKMFLPREPFVAIKNTITFRPHDGVDGKYLYYALINNKIQRRGGGQPFIGKSDTEEYEIPLPIKEKQLEIVNSLEKMSSILNSRIRELHLLDTLIKARFVEMFGDPFQGTNFEIKKLRDVSESISDGSNVDKENYQSSGAVLFLRIQNVWFNEFRLEDSVFISDEVNRQYYDTSLHHGDLLITKIGRFYTPDSSLGRVSVYLGDDDKANYSNNIMRVRLIKCVHYEFINALMNLDDYNKYIRRVSVGGTDKRALSKSIIGDLPIVIPPLALQMEFVEFIHQVDKTKAVVQAALDNAQLLFDSLMQQYFC